MDKYRRHALAVFIGGLITGTLGLAIIFSAGDRIMGTLMVLMGFVFITWADNSITQAKIEDAMEMIAALQKKEVDHGPDG